MSLSEQINADLKQAMISGDKRKVSVLRGIKSAIQYAQVEAGANTLLTESQMTQVLQKESKKRSDARELYLKAADKERADNELYEKELISQYLPKMLSEEEINQLIDAASGGRPIEQKDMGKVIGQVKQASKGAADGSQVANLVKARLRQ